MALGDAVDRRSGGPVRKTESPKVRGRRTRQQIAIRALVAASVLGTGFVGGGYFYFKWRYGKVANLGCAANACLPTLSGEPFNILSIGSDSRAGLTGSMAAQTGVGSVSGQRSDVVKIIHVDPKVPSISVISIPRDTLVSLQPGLAHYFGSRFQRINVNLAAGPGMKAGPAVLARTITANFGIPINHIVEVGFGGLANSVISLGGVWMNFPYTAGDPNSGLRIFHTGCQHLTGMQALAVARSRHFYWSPHNLKWGRHEQVLAAHGYTPAGWIYDGTSDYGRIHRQDAFLRSLMLVAKKEYNPLKLNQILAQLPAGVQLDSGFSMNTVIAIAVKFHNFDPSAMQTYTLPVRSPGPNPYGSVLVTDTLAAQQLFVKIFGKGLVTPTTPAPNAHLQSLPFPYVPIPTTSTTLKHNTTTTVKHHHHTTTTVVHDGSYFDPVPCAPQAAK